MGVFLAQKMGLAVEETVIADANGNTAVETPAMHDFLAELDMRSDDDILKELMGKS